MADRTVAVTSHGTWGASTAYALGNTVTNDSLKIYKCITAGTSAGSGGPTGTGSDITDGTVHWAYKETVAAVYTSLSTALATEDDTYADLTAMAGVLYFHCYPQSVTARVDTGAGWTTSSTCYLHIRCPAGERHSGVWDSNYFNIVYSSATQASFYIQEHYTRVGWIQAAQNRATDGYHIFNYDALGGVVIYNCIGANLHADIGATVGFQQGVAISAETHSYLVNCVAYHCVMGHYGRATNVNYKTYAINVTAYGCTTGFRTRGGYGYAYNLMAIDCTNTYTETDAYAVADYCAYNAGGDPGTNGLDLGEVDLADIFVDAANGDFDLVNERAGTNLYDQYPFTESYVGTVDIAGTSRGGSGATWSVGAFEYVAAGGATTLTAAQGSASITGQAARLLWHQAVKAEQGAVSITGQAANLLWHQAVKAEQGAAAITGQDITLTIIPAAGANSIVAAQGAVAITGQAANLLWHQAVKAEQAAVAATGQAARLLRHRLLKTELPIGTQRYSNGNLEQVDAHLYYDTARGAVDLETTTVHGGSQSLRFTRNAEGSTGYVVDTDNFTLTDGNLYIATAWVYNENLTNIYIRFGETVGGVVSNKVTTTGNWQRCEATFKKISTQHYLLIYFTGSDGQKGYVDDISITDYTPAINVPDARLNWQQHITAAQGAVAITGQAARLNWHQAVKAEQGAVAISGQAARLQWMHSLKAEQGALATTGNDVDLLAYRLLKALHASVTATGQTVSLRYSGAIVGTPAERTYKVPAESRRIVIPAESRTMVIAAENRTIAIGR